MAKKEFTGINLTLPTCRLAFPVVFEKKMNDLKGKEEWSVTMLFEKGKEDLAKLKQTMIQAAKNEFGPDVDLGELDLKRIKDGDAPKADGTEQRPEFKGQWVVKAATRLKAPGVVDSRVQKILDPNEIYSGVFANVNVTVKAYGQPNRGVTLYLNHVQKVKDGEQIAGGPREADVFSEFDIAEADVDAQVDAGAADMDGMFS